MLAWALPLDGASASASEIRVYTVGYPGNQEYPTVHITFYGKEDGEKAYKCDVKMEVALSGKTNKGIAPIRFVKGSDGWRATK